MKKLLLILLCLPIIGFGKYVLDSRSNQLHYYHSLNDIRYQIYTLKDISDKLILYIQEMKYDLVCEVDNNVVFLGNYQEILDKNGKPNKDSAIINKKFSSLTIKQKKMPIALINRKDERYAAADLFMPKTLAKKHQPATILKNKIIEFKDYAILLSRNNQILVDQINLFSDISDKVIDSKKQDWETNNFYNRPAVGVLAILSKIQLDIRTIELDLINYLNKKN